MKNPLVSIITPSLNQGVFIRQTLESVFAQDYPNIEYIVMDACSKDSTVSILRSFEQKLKIKNQKSKIRFYWRSEKDRGQASAINKGMRMAHGDILCYLNSDDVLEPNALSTIVEVFKKNKQCMWVTGDYRIVNEDGNEIQSLIQLYKKFLRYFPLSLIVPIANLIVQPSTFWRKEVMEHIGLFDETLRYVFDYDFWIRISKKYPPIIAPIILSAFRIHHASKGGTSYKEQFAEEMVTARRYYKNPFFLFTPYTHGSLSKHTVELNMLFCKYL